ncbi:intraflagellar transport protein 25 homolog isoform X4 [Fukomys damarensis]|uniref:intraflagellar transport protein 25 homolog isoform X4 n=1 Tax=Fukomys damarensis TaxID=885580 RepID=UPI001455C685|nr:intraflagellar transport protein 25 homolog isoform X4 [Fukomys damarensis]
MRKADLCLSSEGAEVILATSSDEKHPPENIIDGNAETFWTTTGMFPQEFIICFHKHVKIEKIIIQSYLVRTLRVEKSTSKEPVGFEQWIEKDLVHTEGQLQNEEIMRSSVFTFVLHAVSWLPAQTLRLPDTDSHGTLR